MAKHRRDQRDEHRRQGDDHRRNHEEQRRQDDQHRPPHAGHPKPQRFNHLPSQALKRDQTTNGKRNLGQVVLAQPHFQKGLEVEMQNARSRRGIVRSDLRLLSGMCNVRSGRFTRRRLLRQHRPQRLGLVPFQGVDSKFRPRGAGGVDTKAAHPKDPLHHILFHVDGLDTLEGDVDFLTNEDALVHVKGAVVHVEGEAPKMKHRTQKRQHCSRHNRPNEILRAAVLLHVSCDQNWPGCPQHHARLPAHEHQQAHDVLTSRHGEPQFRHPCGFRACDGCCAPWPCSVQESPNWRPMHQLCRV